MNKVTKEFFYTGAHRGEILDALLYVLMHGEGPEGIITLTGEPGSGVSTLCRLAMKQLPAQMQAIYIAQPPLSSTELFNLIAEKLTTVGAVRQRGVEENGEIENGVSALGYLQNLLDQKHAANTQVVLLLDEAQRMTIDMLEEIRALYELGSSRHKLLQIVLAGQNELQRNLASPSVHKLKGLIAHRYHLNPLGPSQVAEYLRSRARMLEGQAVMFTPRAIKIIGMVSGGLIEALNRLADKSSDIAASEKAREVTEEHARKAIEESGGKYRLNWRGWSNWYSPIRYRSGAGLAASLMMLAVLGGFGLHAPSTKVSPEVASTVPEVASPLPSSVPATVVVAPAPVAVYPSNLPAAVSAPNAASQVLTAAAQTQAPPRSGAKPGGSDDQPTPVAGQGPGKFNIGGVKLAGFRLLEQRVESTIKTMETVEGNKYTIQLFSTENIQPDRMERFLIRAQSLVDLSNLYVHIVKNGDKAKFRVTYGIYPGRDDAATAVEGLPEKYQSAFHPELFAFADFR